MSHDADLREPARPLLPDGGMLRMPRHHRRDRQPPGLHDPGAGRDARRDAARQAGIRRMTAPNELRDRYDVAVVGAGPAGLAAAHLCARSGLDCVLLDDQPGPGGQIYRAVAASPLPRGTVLGPDYWRGETLVRAALESGAHHVAGAAVWGLPREGELAASVAGGSRLLRASRIILATGALVPHGRTVLAGCGPLVWLLAWQYLNAGVRLEAILDTTPQANRRRALGELASFAASPYLAKGLRLMLAVRRALRVVGG